MIFIVHQLVEQRIVIGVVDQVSHQQLIGRTETRTYAGMPQDDMSSAAVQKPYQALAA